jgi:hypothetical protein
MNRDKSIAKQGNQPSRSAFWLSVFFFETLMFWGMFFLLSGVGHASPPVGIFGSIWLLITLVVIPMNMPSTLRKRVLTGALVGTLGGMSVGALAGSVAKEWAGIVSSLVIGANGGVLFTLMLLKGTSLIDMISNNAQDYFVEKAAPEIASLIKVAEGVLYSLGAVLGAILGMRALRNAFSVVFSAIDSGAIAGQAMGILVGSLLAARATNERSVG